MPRLLFEPMHGTAAKRFVRWVESVIRSGPYPSAGTLVGYTENTAPVRNISPHQWDVSARLLARYSYGVAPDHRHGPRPAMHDEPVVLFRNPGGTPVVAPVSDEYPVLLRLCAIGCFLVRERGGSPAKELRFLRAAIDAADVTDTERAALKANLRWMLKVHLSFSSVQSAIRNARADTHEMIVDTAVAIAMADGEVDPETARLLDRICLEIGLDWRDYHNRYATPCEDLGPVTVREADAPEARYAIPPPPEQSRGVVLNKRRVEKLIQETDEVVQVLGPVLSDKRSGPNAETSISEHLTGLDASYKDFLPKLVQRGEWEATELTTLARRQGLMPEGALEAINEWCLDRFDDVLVDELDEYYVLNQDVVTQLRSGRSPTV